MAYTTYLTQAIVCGSDAFQTSDRSYLLFTREAGMVYAHARSVREERSKQRYALQEFSEVRVALLRGKMGWRIAGVEPVANYFMQSGTREKRATTRSILMLIRRLMHGEIAHHALFDDCVSALHFVALYDHAMVYRVFSLRMLHTLGYVSPAPEYASALSVPSLADALNEAESINIPLCDSVIAHALEASHL